MLETSVRYEVVARYQIIDLGDAGKCPAFREVDGYIATPSGVLIGYLVFVSGAKNS